ncbi:DNA topoisomerase III [Enterococcus durans]|uniref:DNA topoisomerase n=1 Tax=Enterococcus durans TaxID=53345 RepID=A0A5N0YMC2_9ENTE|nr:MULTISPECIES: type IA DNA topoisomerase [Enterococcus]KAA9180132.1 DNA topoisomerase III [Enterococcus durans]KAA9187258.1 DNA topoisomerase III [Enterococcus durans]KAA9187426.1 DNA topoisomerase III [Enterococcus durans]KAA9191237.1 DNA topoisomerase III [Enterococcus durans]KAA9192413.1 DNA topoisomerase III [Enterococcus durans]
MKTVILAEKPSQAKAYAETFKQRKRHPGYYEIADPLFTGEVTITYGFGHLVDMLPPGAYEERWAKWSLTNLPIFPEEFRYEVPADKREQFSIVKRELQSADTIIIATDGDREGEAIAWSIIIQAKAFTKEKKYLRLWINSLEKEAIYEGFKQLRPGEHYFSKYKEARARQNADWLIGMNGSPLYSLLLQQKGIDGSFSLGRVQTPTLYMIYQLQESIRNFKKEPYFESEVKIVSKNGRFIGKMDPKKSFKSSEELVKEIERLGAHLGKQPGKILDVSKKEKQLSSPRLFSLSSLQSKMNKLMKASAKATLDAVQGLYESKFLSYPRTDSFYITENEHQYLVRNLAKYKTFLGIENVPTPDTYAKKRYVDAKKVQEHHAIIPTKTIPSKERFAKLSRLQQAIYLQVVRTTIAMFAENYIYEETVIQTGVENLRLKSTGRIPVKKGWQAILETKNKKKDLQQLPVVEKDEVVEVDLASIEKETQPPKPYNEGTLITAMKTAGKTLDDEEAQEILKEVEGIGTEATRANIIENLKQRHYIEVNKNEITVTAKGITLCKAVTDEPLLTSAEMTARWEGYLRKIGNREGTTEVFLENIKKFILHLLESVPKQIEKVDLSKEITGTRQIKAMEKKNDQLGHCPKCKQGIIMLYPKVATCTNPACEFKLWPTIAKKKLTKTNLRELLSKGKTSKVIKGFTGKKGKFDAVLVLKDDLTIGFSFPWMDQTADTKKES